RHGELSPQEFVRDMTQGLLTTPAVHLLSAPVPGSDGTVPVADEDGVVGQVDEVRLLAQPRLRTLPRGDVAGGSDDARDPPRLIPIDRRVIEHGDGVPVPVPDLQGVVTDEALAEDPLVALTGCLRIREVI